jgi:ATP/maltotriose-dependent transcriptional regulator MalT
VEAADLLVRARSAYAEGLWGDAYALFAHADADHRLGVEDLERLGLAAFLTGHDEESTDAWTKAHRARAGAGQPEQAARDAFLIGSNLIFRGELAPAQGWFARGGRLVAGRPEGAGHGWLLTLTGLARMFTGDPAGAEPAFATGVQTAQAHRDEDLLTMAQLGAGMCRLLLGDLDTGMPMLDECMVGVTAGEVSPMYAGMAYCTVIMGCADVFDLQRAQQWTAALARWCDSQPGLVPFRGNCLVHRCELMRLRGSWGEALQAARDACGYLSGPVKWDTLGSAYYQLAEVQRLRGDFEYAEQNYRRSNEAGHRPEPGVALLRLAQGRADAAAAMLRRALEETTDGPARAKLLPAQVEVMLAMGNVGAAKKATAELHQIARTINAPYLLAMADSADGGVLLASGEPGGALPQLRKAATLWRDLDCPYELAKTRALIAFACRELKDPETATMELDAARAELERLGAKPDLDRLDANLVSSARGSAQPKPTARELDVLKLVAEGLTNRAIAKKLGLSEKTVARHVSNLLTRLDLPSRAAATAYAYQHRLI